MLYPTEKLRFFAAAIGASLIAIAAAVAPSEAYAGTRHQFAAELGAPAEKPQLIASGTLWTCDGQSCAAAAELSTSPRRFCAQLAASVGTLTSFRVDNVTFEAEQLDRCNAAAD